MSSIRTGRTPATAKASISARVSGHGGALLPHAGIGWQAHVGGLLGGVVAGWVFRDRRATARGAAKGTVAGAPKAGLGEQPAATWHLVNLGRAGQTGHARGNW